MRGIDVCNIKCTRQFCVLIIIIHVTYFERTLALYTRNPAVEMQKANNKSLEVAATLATPQIFSRLAQLKAFRSRIRKCVEQTQNTTWSCIKISTLEAFDEFASAAVIPIWSGVRFVRSKAPLDIAQMKDDLAYERQDLQHITWFDSLSMRLAKVMHTHVLEMNFKDLTDAYMAELDKKDANNHPNSRETSGEARGRRHRFNMMMTMMFGVTALGAVLVPMGFQLLSIVSGKALLLAKMALLLASINGLKRVANSGVHYGLYQVPGEHYNGYYDRNDLQHHPRNVASVAVAQPIEYGIRK